MKRNFDYWKEQYEKDKAHVDRQKMKRWKDIYRGSRAIEGRVESESGNTAEASSVRNIAFELIEAQVDSTIPTPKVTARHAGDEHLAQMIEDVIRAELDRLPIEELNDRDERTTYITGGDFWIVEWDDSLGGRNYSGEITMRLCHPENVVPQRGVNNLDDADYIFIRLPQTRNYIKRRYGVDVETEPAAMDDLTADRADSDMCLQVICYYRTDDGGIGLLSWVGDTILEDVENYGSRHVRTCDNCGELVGMTDKTCPACGKNKFTTEVRHAEDMIGPLEVRGDAGETKILDPIVPYPDGSIGRREIPYYEPNAFPVVLRKNVSVEGELLGNSDIEAIKDQQNSMNKITSKIDEKTMKGGSIFTRPQGVAMQHDDEQLKIVEIESPDQVGMFRVFPIEADITMDMALAERNYEWARNVIGITDSFQGRRDSSATSGRAKEFSAAQAAGRFESKRVMKQAAYARMFELMFKYLLAYADEERQYKVQDENGDDSYCSFNRYDFLKEDAAGQLYWEDGFIFGVDTTGTLASNREAMWQETRMNFKEGAFGDPRDPETIILFWKMMKSLHYPKASEVLNRLLKRQEEAQAAQAGPMMAGQMGPQGPGMVPPEAQAAMPAPQLPDAGGVPGV